ncbi:hypothetical protein ACFQY4_42225 [Catellatospora bangladeshensis]
MTTLRATSQQIPSEHRNFSPCCGVKMSYRRDRQDWPTREAMNMMTRTVVLRQKQAMRQRIRATVHARRIAVLTDPPQTQPVEEPATAR